ncbi:MAG TPA: hypothetical protein VFU95_09705, partial [Telluria sp.]|nr:hypothetical protein [Telluria sp.]
MAIFRIGMQSAGISLAAAFLMLAILSSCIGLPTPQEFTLQRFAEETEYCEHSRVSGYNTRAAMNTEATFL